MSSLMVVINKDSYKASRKETSGTALTKDEKSSYQRIKETTYCYRREEMMTTRNALMRLCKMIIIIFCLTFIGCASFPGHQLPRYTYENISTQPAREKPSADYDVDIVVVGDIARAADSGFQEKINKVFTNSHMFEKLVYGIGSEKYHLSFLLRRDNNIGIGVLSLLSLYFSLYSGTILPCIVRDEYILMIRVKKEDRFVKEYQYSEYIYSVLQLFMIVFMPSNSPPQTFNSMIDNMLLNFLHDAARDKIFVEVAKNY